jgi:hypothetical protein
MYSPQGTPVKELADASLDAVQWAAREGATGLNVAYESDDYAWDPRYWGRDSIGGMVALVLMPSQRTDPQGREQPGAGLPHFAGIVTGRSSDGDTGLSLSIEGCQAALSELAITEQVELSGGLGPTLRELRERCASDSYPVRIGRVEEFGPDLQGPLRPQSLRTAVDTLVTQCGGEWTVEPVLDAANNLTFDVVVRRRLGTAYGSEESLNAGVEILDDPEQTVDYYGVKNEVTALGNADRYDKSPSVTVEAAGRIRRPYGVRRSAVVQAPDITDRARLVAYARSVLARRAYPRVSVAARITPALRGARAFQMMRVGNTFRLGIPDFDGLPVRLEAFGWSRDTDEVQMTLRHRYADVGGDDGDL